MSFKSDLVSPKTRNRGVPGALLSGGVTLLSGRVTGSSWRTTGGVFPLSDLADQVSYICITQPVEGSRLDSGPSVLYMYKTVERSRLERVSSRTRLTSTRSGEA